MIASALVGLLLVLVLTSCTPSALEIQARTADTLARAVNAATPELVNQEEKLGFAAIEKADTKEHAQAALQVLEQQWKPVWVAVDVLAAAQSAWATAIENKAEPSPALFFGILKAACSLAKTVGEVAPSVAGQLSALSAACP